MKNTIAFLKRSMVVCIIGITAIYPARSQSAKNTRDIAIKWINLLNQHDTIALATLYTDSVEIQSPNWEGSKTGKAVIRDTYSRYFTSTPDLQQNIANIIASDTSVIIEYIFHGTLQNPEHGTPEYMRGKKYALSACTVMLIRNGKIAQQRTYFDQVAFLRQVGFFDQK